MVDNMFFIIIVLNRKEKMEKNEENKHVRCFEVHSDKSTFNLTHKPNKYLKSEQSKPTTTTEIKIKRRRRSKALRTHTSKDKRTYSKCTELNSVKIKIVKEL